MIIKTDPITDEIIYPSSDGKRMADNTKQYRYINVIKGNLDILFADQTDVFIAGDLLWYPVMGRPDIATAPDVMLVFGRQKGDRMSYQQWKEENIAPQVVFEILSPSNSVSEMNRKLQFYDRYHVQEYYVYDPDSMEFFAYKRQPNVGLTVVQENLQGYKSPLLGIEFEIEGKELKIYHPNGFPFLGYEELSASREREYQERVAKEKELEATEKVLAATQEALEATEKEKNDLLEANRKLQELLKNAGIKMD
jgi:Uma2 family endonuclease